MRLLVLYLFSVSAVALASADGPDFYDVQNVKKDDMLNLRVAHSANAKVIIKIPLMAKKIKNLGERWPAYHSDAPPTAQNLAGRDELSPDEKAALLKGLSWCRVEYQKKQGWVLCKYLVESN